VILIASLLFDAAARPQRAARLVVRAEAEAAAAPKAAPKKEVGPKRGSTVRAAATLDSQAHRQLNSKQDRSCCFIETSCTTRHSQLCSRSCPWVAGPAGVQQAVLAASGGAVPVLINDLLLAGQDPEARELLVQPDRQGRVC
jgi:hypothetical protein